MPDPDVALVTWPTGTLLVELQDETGGAVQMALQGAELRPTLGASSRTFVLSFKMGGGADGGVECEFIVQDAAFEGFDLFGKALATES